MLPVSTNTDINHHAKNMLNINLLKKTFGWPLWMKSLDRKKKAAEILLHLHSLSFLNLCAADISHLYIFLHISVQTLSLFCFVQTESSVPAFKNWETAFSPVSYLCRYPPSSHKTFETTL